MSKNEKCLKNFKISRNKKYLKLKKKYFLVKKKSKQNMCKNKKNV